MSTYPPAHPHKAIFDWKSVRIDAFLSILNRVVFLFICQQFELVKALLIAAVMLRAVIDFCKEGALVGLRFPCLTMASPGHKGQSRWKAEGDGWGPQLC